MFQFDKFVSADILDLTRLQPPDWRDIRPRFEYFIQSPNCDPIKLLYNNQTIGIGTTIKHEDTAWLACIIVQNEFRNQGLGSKITLELMNSLNPGKFKTIYLDATDLGFHVYSKIGFQLDCEYQHFKKADDLSSQNVSSNISVLPHSRIRDVLDLDRQVSGENRSFIFMENLKDAKVYMADEEIQGFYLPALGEGLIIAADEEAGLSLMVARCFEKTSASLPSQNEKAVQQLINSHFEFYRNSRRMYFGEPRKWNPSGLFNRISGQLG